MRDEEKACLAGRARPEDLERNAMNIGHINRAPIYAKGILHAKTTWPPATSGGPRPID
ncbi:hypothetical protein ACPRNU_20305 [Chromobacterium vaccinii]|uniref:hypothetical protein n=1 Tax=Chromobacterium TaxID=535 RepID=UPI0013053521|nr:hypothetical protein [Chromobacterium sp. ATCC 53434]